MFDTYNLRSVTERVTQNVNVTEKRAPTDESVRLLREMESEAQKRLVSSTRVEGCPIDCVLHTRHDHLTGDIECAVVYRIKGGENIRVDYRHRDFSICSRDEALDNFTMGLVEAVAKDIAIRILTEPFRKIVSKGMFP